MHRDQCETYRSSHLMDAEPIVLSASEWLYPMTGNMRLLELPFLALLGFKGKGLILILGINGKNEKRKTNKTAACIMHDTHIMR